MDRFFLVKWRDSLKCEHIIGMLAKIKSVYCFMYNPELKDKENEIYKNGFSSIPSFGDPATASMKIAKELFSFFNMRIPKEDRADIWKEYGIEKYDICDVLSHSNATIPTDSYFLEEIDNEEVKERFDEIDEISNLDR